MLASSVHEIRRFQQASYCFQTVPEIQEYLATQLQSAPDVHDMYERSCVLEPRGRGEHRHRDSYTPTGGMTTSMVIACMILDD
jgi:hypothetical protein